MSKYNFYESLDDEQVSSLVNSDLDKVDPQKLKDMDAATADKVASEREKELQKAGVDTGGSDYAAKLSAGLRAKGIAGDGNGDFMNSEVLKQYESSWDWEDSSWALLNEDVDNQDEQDFEKMVATMANNGIEAAGEPTTSEGVSANQLDGPLDTDSMDSLLDVNTDNNSSSVGDEEASSTLDNLTIDNPTSVNDQPSATSYIDSSNEITDDSLDDYISKDALSDEENDLINSAIKGTEEDDDIQSFEDEEEDVVIKIKNPRKLPIDISIKGKEEEINSEIEDELDKFASKDNSFSQKDFVEHLCIKYRVNPHLLRESRTTTDKICKIISIVARR